MNLSWFLLLLSYGHIQATYGDLKPSSIFTLTVRPKESITLTCDITDKYEVAWYHLNSMLEELTLLIFAKKTRTRKSLPFSYNKNESRFILSADGEITIANLTILEVGKDDLGLYFCGTTAEWSQMRFARAFKLQFKDTDHLSSPMPSKTEGENTDEVSMVERLLMLGGVGVVALVFLMATVAAGIVVHKRAWRSGWAEGRDSYRRCSEKR
ncbi:uncharacterized protein LOC108413234 [Pygocentrus nattereri]|uniref:uncharacterized protein LOC108413234 n=1 Tax=Pygocentrus nattereri TaxID=42514 RepID=UPI000814638C|nr:uncharacterized protein LOC108413234 [Pygocentrus nattereri]